MTLGHFPLDIAKDAKAVARRALAEDGPTDITSDVVGAAGLNAVGSLEYRSGGVVAGLRYAEEVVRQCGGQVLDWQVEEGAAVPPHAEIGQIRGDMADMLRAERPMLNLLQRACGIASATRSFVQAVTGTRCRVLHTRKTAPGLRGLDASAVVAGGGALHRLDLSTAVLLKDNHWKLLQRRKLTLQSACDEAKSRGVTAVYVEVESPDQVRAACAAGATRLLVDNQTPETFRAWADLARGLAPHIELEASGGITLDVVREYALAGADFVSVGALTHSAVAADVALEVLD